MISVHTAYPCIKCGKKIGSYDVQCKYCGAKQPDLDTKSIYNIFYRYKGSESFSIRYTGDLILSVEDIRELVENLRMTPDYEYFVGTYDYLQLKASDRSNFRVTSWYPVVNGELGENQIDEAEGSRLIKITILK